MRDLKMWRDIEERRLRNATAVVTTNDQVKRWAEAERRQPEWMRRARENRLPSKDLTRV